MPLSKQIHQDRALEQISIAYSPGKFIAEQLVSRVPVKHESDIYYVYSTDIMSLPETIRANGAEANRANFNISTSSYSLTEHALKEVVTDRDRDNSDDAISLNVDMTEVLTQMIMIRKETEAATVAQTPANWSNKLSLTSTLAWTANTTASDPIQTIDSGTSIIIKSSGMVPNKLVFDDPSFRALRVHVSIVDRIKYTTADSISEKMLGAMFDVPDTMVARATFEGAEEGLATSKSFIWTNSAFLAYIEPSPGLKKPSAMYQFMKRNQGAPVKVTRWREDKLDGEMIEVSSMFQYKAVATLAAYLIIDTT